MPLFYPIELVSDDYWHTAFYPQANESAIQSISEITATQSRYVNYLFGWITENIFGVSVTGTYVITPLLFLLGLAITAFLITRFWKLTESFAAMLIAMLLILLHPLIQDHLFFRLAGYIMAPVFPLAVLPFLFFSENTPFQRNSAKQILFMILGALCFAAAFGAYQTLINVSFGVFFLYIAVQGVRQFKDTDASFSILYKTCNVPQNLIMLFGGCILYAAFVYDFRYITNTKSHYLPVISFGISDIVLQLISCSCKICRLFNPVHAEYGITMNWIPLGTLLLIITAILRTAKFNLRRICFAVFLIAMLLFAGFAAVIGIWILIVWVNQPRYWMGTAFFIAGIFAVAYTMTGSRVRSRIKYKEILISFFTFLLLGYSFFLSQLETDFVRLNEMDRALLYRVINTLEQRDDFTNIKRVCLFGNVPQYQEMFPSCRSGFLRSVMSYPYARAYSIRRLSGYQWICVFEETVYWICRAAGMPEKPPSQEEIDNYAQKYLDTVPVFPAKGSIIIVDGNTAVIKIADK